MLNKLTTDIRELIERSLANNKQPWSYYVRVRVETDDREIAITITSEEKITDEEIEETTVLQKSNTKLDF